MSFQGDFTFQKLKGATCMPPFLVLLKKQKY